MRIVLIQRLTGFHHLDQVRRGDDLHRLAWCESETPLERALVILGDSIVHFESKIPYSMPVPCIDHLGRLFQDPAYYLLRAVTSVVQIIGRRLELDVRLGVSLVTVTVTVTAASDGSS